jgi:hypothetical protein
MKTTSDYAGLDYAHGLANIDLKTGIRYGVISLNSCSPEWLAEFEPYYGDDADSDFAEPISWAYDKDGIKAEYGGDSNTMFIFESPVIVRAQYCSPCYPGAGNLDCLCPDGPKTYGLPDDCLINLEN